MPDIKKGGGLRSLAPIVDQTEQFLEKQNVPKDQVVPFLMSLGRPELAGAVADRMRLDAAAEQMKAMQQGQAAPPTVVQENRAQAQGLMSMVPQQRPMMPGQQPIPQMAGGGVVAFANGSTVRLPKSEVFSDAGFEEYIRNNFPNWDQLPEDQKREVARAMKDQYLSAQGRAMQREAVDPRMRRGYVAPAPAPAAAPVAGLPAALPAAPAPAAPPAVTPAGFIAPDTQGALFDQMMQSASRPTPPAAPIVPRSTTASVTTRRSQPVAPSSTEPVIPDITKPQTLAERTAARIAEEKAAGITNDATKAYEDFLKARTAEIPEEKKAAYKNAWMMAGARLLGSRSPFFAQALGEAAEAGISGYQKDLKEIKAAEQALRQADMQLRMNREAIARGDLRADQAEVQRQQDNYTNRQFKLYELQETARQKALDRAVDITVAKMRNVTGAEDRISRLQSLYDATQEPGLSPQEKQAREDRLAKQISMDRQFTAATTSGGYAADIRSDTARDALLQRVREGFAYRTQQLKADNKARPEEERAAARAEMQRLESVALREAGISSPDYAPRSQNISGGPYSDKSDDDIKRLLNEQFGIR